MKRYKIRVSPSVHEELELIYLWIRKDAPLAAENHIRELYKAIASLAELPERCSVSPENEYVEKQGDITIRHFIYKNSYRIIFTVLDDEVRILSVRHVAQLPNTDITLC